MIELSVSETKQSSLLARTRALILYISICIFDFGPEKLPGLSRNGPLVKSSRTCMEQPFFLFNWQNRNPNGVSFHSYVPTPPDRMYSQILPLRACLT